MSKRIIEAIKKVCSDVDNADPWLNYGGCGVFAASMAYQLNKIGKTKIRVLDLYGNSNGVSIDELRETLINKLNPLEWQQKGVEFNHVIVEFEYNGRVFHVDSIGVVEVDPKAETYPRNYGLSHDIKIIDGHFSIYEMRKFLKEHRAWNSMFNRDNIPKIQKKISQGFKKIIQEATQ